MQQAIVNTIEGKVAKILNTRELVINRGADDGVKDGMRFEVVDDFAPIFDPDTGETLGTIKRVKIRVKVSHVQPRFSIARTYETYQASNFAAVFASMTSPRTVTRVKTIASGSETTPIEEGESYVDVGDKVVQMDLD